MCMLLIGLVGLIIIFPFKNIILLRVVGECATILAFFYREGGRVSFNGRMRPSQG